MALGMRTQWLSKMYYTEYLGWALSSRKAKCGQATAVEKGKGIHCLVTQTMDFMDFHFNSMHTTVPELEKRHNEGG
jgi:hypothetical protein